MYGKGLKNILVKKIKKYLEEIKVVVSLHPL